MNESPTLTASTPVSELVRPAPPEWLRLVGLGAVLLLGVLFFAGSRPLTWGSSGGIDTSRSPEGRLIVDLSMELSNHGILPIEVVGVRAPAGTGAARVQSGPVRIAAFSSRTVKVAFEITNCSKIDHYEKAITLAVRSVPFGWTREEKIDLPFGGLPESGPETGWLTATADGACTQ